MSLLPADQRESRRKIGFRSSPRHASAQRVHRGPSRAAVARRACLDGLVPRRLLVDDRKVERWSRGPRRRSNRRPRCGSLRRPPRRRRRRGRRGLVPQGERTSQGRRAGRLPRVRHALHAHHVAHRARTRDPAPQIQLVPRVAPLLPLRLIRAGTGPAVLVRAAPHPAPDQAAPARPDVAREADRAELPEGAVVVRRAREYELGGDPVGGARSPRRTRSDGGCGVLRYPATSTAAGEEVGARRVGEAERAVGAVAVVAGRARPGRGRAGGRVEAEPCHAVVGRAEEAVEVHVVRQVPLRLAFDGLLLLLLFSSSVHFPQFTNRLLLEMSQE